MIFILLTSFIFSSGYFWQESYDACKDQNFQSSHCELQKKAHEAK